MALSLLCSGAAGAAAEVVEEAWVTVHRAGLRQEYVRAAFSVDGDHAARRLERDARR